MTPQKENIISRFLQTDGPKIIPSDIENSSQWLYRLFYEKQSSTEIIEPLKLIHIKNVISKEICNSKIIFR
jgi:adenine-specific DNA methylase